MRSSGKRCAGDEVLQKEVVSLLAADDFVADFLQEPVADLAVAVLAEENLRETDIVPEPMQPPSLSLIGQTVGNRYEIIKRLGGGGFARSSKASDTKVMSRPVVIKVLKDDRSQKMAQKEDWVVTKFRQEIEALAKIDDPGVVHILDADTLPDGRPYIVMEFVEGSDLRHFMADAQTESSTVPDFHFRTWQKS